MGWLARKRSQPDRVLSRGLVVGVSRGFLVASLLGSLGCFCCRCFASFALAGAGWVEACRFCARTTRCGRLWGRGLICVLGAPRVVRAVPPSLHRAPAVEGQYLFELSFTSLVLSLENESRDFVGCITATVVPSHISSSL